MTVSASAGSTRGQSGAASEQACIQPDARALRGQTQCAWPGSQNGRPAESKTRKCSRGPHWVVTRCWTAAGETADGNGPISMPRGGRSPGLQANTTSSEVSARPGRKCRLSLPVNAFVSAMRNSNVQCSMENICSARYASQWALLVDARSRTSHAALRRAGGAQPDAWRSCSAALGAVGHGILRWRLGRRDS